VKATKRGLGGGMVAHFERGGFRVTEEMGDARESARMEGE
jgi:hypothetical protein